MMKRLVLALLAFVSVPASAAEIFIEGSFGETMEVTGDPGYAGPPGAPVAFSILMSFDDAVMRDPDDPTRVEASAVTLTIDGESWTDIFYAIAHIPDPDAASGTLDVAAFMAGGADWERQLLMTINLPDRTFDAYHSLLGLRTPGETRFAYHGPTITTFRIDDALLALPMPEVIRGVPEPATWALMIFGFGIAGGALRRRGELVTA